MKLPFKAPRLTVCVQLSYGVSAVFEVICVSLPPVLPPELPYGWEKIEDPQYGTYYVE